MTPASRYVLDGTVFSYGLDDWVVGQASLGAEAQVLEVAGTQGWVVQRGPQEPGEKEKTLLRPLLDKRYDQVTHRRNDNDTLKLSLCDFVILT